MLNKEDILKLKRFCQHITESPLPTEKQDFTRSDGHLWCREWETIEILKCLFLGTEIYLNDPPPRRLKNNPLWSQRDIITTAEAILKESKNIDEVIETLKRRRHASGQ